ncbi:Mu-like prophage major head subunit gpT family protein [Gluconacetobacter entanii]|uniref:Mu-like prophage major head subunit gpT family protein n=1 Tax=Gluconacetobacter entanii TaxID=108528 RepID=A0ABT3K1R9_9PROT|nr:Mu-like prophage major head subunit gpT family protein [Gluconacetobacter entanii]MCW4589350.1 Mu-like prophage major head subunit gpT family protein [Gluconacetobacter entanii]MCW4592981.1 Mu-like prophage major head subunit gpT family protein [Gluconacetobacter entanii]NPC90242.1 head protein [Gluconacetobacter entanii]
MITVGYVKALDTMVSLAFNKYLNAAAPSYKPFTMEVPSSSGANFYPKLSELPGFRKWIGARVVHRLDAAAMSIKNEPYEQTISISRDDMEDKNVGFLSVAVAQIGADAAELPDKLVYEQLQAGFKKKCMDGQYFFDSDHETCDENGNTVSYSNVGMPQEGETAGPWWYLFDNTQPLKAMIYQPRRPFTITAKTKLTDGNVFNEAEFVWGADGRCAAGFGMFQLAYASCRPLNATSFADAVSAMGMLRRRDGTPYGISPSQLVVPKNLESAGRALLKGGFIPTLAPDGKTWIPGSNQWEKAAELVIAPRLSYANGG